jgi:nitroimidazol reductase NimA-like FMN-containing flavoprotein (pyridoxamine 5'-phosphate oxidase superfamily)
MSIDAEKIKEEALAFIKSELVAVVATCYDDIPHAAATYYLVDDEFIFYFLTKSNTSKYMNASMNDRAAIVVGTGPKHSTVQSRGIMEILIEDERLAVLEAFRQIYSSEHMKEWPIDVLEKFKDEEYVALRFSPIHLTFINIDNDRWPHSLGPHIHYIISR